MLEQRDASEESAWEVCGRALEHTTKDLPSVPAEAPYTYRPDHTTHTPHVSEDTVGTTGICLIGNVADRATELGV